VADVARAAEETENRDPRPPRRGAGRRWASRLLLTLGLVFLGLWSAAWVENRVTEMVEGRRLEAALEGAGNGSRPAAAAATEGKRTGGEEGRAAAPAPPPEPGSLIGRIEAPRLDLSAIVLAGLDPGLLRRAAGHVPGTALPGDGGNVAVAGHRDLHFGPLRDVATGDEITFTTPTGVHRYRVSATEVVDPDGTHVLADRGRDELTLITCYPFHYIGPAPRRFVVHAQRVTD
jgi:sortase A